MFQRLLHCPTHTPKYPLPLRCLLTQQTGRVQAAQRLIFPTMNNAFAVQLKKLYRGVEGKILKDEADDGLDDGRVVVRAAERR
jgi:hypothetical protein